MTDKPTKKASVKAPAGHKVPDQTHQVKAQAQQMAQQGQQAVTHVWELGRSQFRAMLTGQKDQAASKLGDVAEVLHQTGVQLRDQGQPGGSRIALNLADRVSQVSTNIHDKEIEEIIADTEDFARRKPAVFLTVATVLGFVLARFLKSSGQAASAA